MHERVEPIDRAVHGGEDVIKGLLPSCQTPGAWRRVLCPLCARLGPAGDWPVGYLDSEYTLLTGLLGVLGCVGFKLKSTASSHCKLGITGHGSGGRGRGCGGCIGLAQDNLRNLFCTALSVGFGRESSAWTPPGCTPAPRTALPLFTPHRRWDQKCAPWPPPSSAPRAPCATYSKLPVPITPWDGQGQVHEGLQLVRR